MAVTRKMTSRESYALEVDHRYPASRGVRLVGRPSPSLPRLLMVCAGSLFMPSCPLAFFMRPGNGSDEGVLS